MVAKYCFNKQSLTQTEAKDYDSESTESSSRESYRPETIDQAGRNSTKGDEDEKVSCRTWSRVVVDLTNSAEPQYQASPDAVIEQV